MTVRQKPRVLLSLTLELGNKVMSRHIHQVVSEMSEVDTVTFFWGEREDYQKFYPKRIPSDVLRTLIGASRKRRALRLNEADAVVMNEWEQVIVFRDLVQSVPCAVFLDATPLQKLRMLRARAGMKHRVSSRLWHCWMRRLARYVTLWCPATEFLASSLQADYNLQSEKVCVVHHGIDLDSWQPAPQKRPRHPRLLFVGNSFEGKGGLFLLQVKALLPKQYELVIVSNDSSVVRAPMDESTLLIQGVDHSRLADLVSWFQSSHLFVFPTWIDAFGVVLIEAAACGTPAIVRDLGPQREAVEHERSGLLMPYHSTPEEWAEAIQQLFVHRERLEMFGRRAREIAEERFSLERLQSQIRHVVSSLIC